MNILPRALSSVSILKFFAFSLIKIFSWTITWFPREWLTKDFKVNKIYRLYLLKISSNGIEIYESVGFSKVLSGVSLAANSIFTSSALEQIQNPNFRQIKKLYFYEIFKIKEKINFYIELKIFFWARRTCLKSRTNPT